MLLAGGAARIRPGSPHDLDALLRLRESLPMPDSPETQHGGFLLGSDPQGYLKYLEQGWVWVLEQERRLSAFCIAFSDEVLRASELWSRSEEIEWKDPEGISSILSARIAYIDQLAAEAQPRARYWSTALALYVLDQLFQGSSSFAPHNYCATTTVIEPVCNQAAWSFLGRACAKRLGELDEHYPSVGRIRSAIFMIEKSEANRSLAPLRRRFFQGPEASSSRLDQA